MFSQISSKNKLYRKTGIVVSLSSLDMEQYTTCKKLHQFMQGQNIADVELKQN